MSTSTTKSTPLLNGDIVSTFVASFEAKDTSSKALFLAMFNHLKTYKENKPVRVEIVKAAVTQFESVTQNNAIIRRAKAIFRLAENYVSLKAFTHIDHIYMYNLETVIKVLEFMKHNHPSDLSKVSNRLSRVYKKGVTPVDYNNELADKLNDIRKEYNIADVDGRFMTLKNNLVKLVDSLTPEQVAELHALTAPKVQPEVTPSDTVEDATEA